MVVGVNLVFDCDLEACKHQVYQVSSEIWPDRVGFIRERERERERERGNMWGEKFFREKKKRNWSGGQVFVGILFHQRHWR